jgi:leucyl aminopeptidase
MEFNVKRTNVQKQATACAVVLFTGDKNLSTSAAQVDEASDGSINKLIKGGDLKLKAGENSWLYPAASTGYERVLVLCVGSKRDAISDKDFRKAFEQAASTLCNSAAKDAVIYLDELTVEGRDHQWTAQVVAEKLATAAYRFNRTKSKNDNLPKIGKITLACEDAKVQRAYKQGLEHGAALGEGINLARELGNLPANICTPKYLAEQAKALADACPELSVKVLSEKQMEKLGMGSLLSVSAGSEQEAQLIVMEYKGTSKGKPHVLVGKGITFDTGGISLKPGAGMDEMKFDMCGAASVLGTMKTLTQLKAPVNVVGIVAASENMPSGRATKPGDVVTSMSGQTIEILNTDAEGRLVLCDALTYAERFKPKTVVDVATLTGACVVALGKHATGLFSNDQELADALLAAGIDADDRAWQMPLWDEYQPLLDSNFADIANIGGPTAGSITAACFLSRFTKKYKWAHLDIAGTAWLSGGKAKGATGRPVGMLVNYLLNNR